MKALIAASLLLAAAPSYAGKLTLTSAAAATTAGVNLLGLPATVRRTRTAFKRSRAAAAKTAKKVKTYVHP